MEEVKRDERFFQLTEEKFQTSSQHMDILLNLQNIPFVLIHLSIHISTS